MKGLRLLKQNNKGVGIVSVIIALSFLATLGLLILAISYTSSEMKSSERIGREVAYNASGVVEQLRSGVELAVSDSIKDCYTGVMTNYSFHRSDIENTFDREFSEALCGWKPYYVDKSGTVYYYISNDDPDQRSIDKSLGIQFLCGTPEIHNVGTENEYHEYPKFNVNALKKFVKARFNVVDDDIIITCLNEDGETATDGLGVAEWKTMTSTDPEDNTKTVDTPVSITLKDIQISYRKIFRTVRISTDIVIDFPDTGFVYQEETHGNKYTEFAIIAKDGFELAAPGGYVKIDGKAYAGNVTVSPKTPSHMLWVGIGGMLVTPGEVEIYGKNTTPNNPTATDPDWPSDSSAFYINNKAELWANGIKVNYDSIVNLRGNTYIKNDLNLAQPKAKAILAGNYYGFGGDDTNPGRSSSIIAQGYSKSNNQTELNISEITTLSLGGYSFVNVVNADGTEIGEGKGRVKMGQSMAVTEDQTAYLVPVDLMQNESKGISLHTNPEVFDTADDYNVFIQKFQKIVDGQAVDEYTLPAGDDSVILKDVPVGPDEFGHEKYTDRTAAYYGITVQPVLKQSGGNAIGYFFMKFASPNQANQFFRDYFATHTDRVTNYTKQYIKLKDLDDNDIDDVVANFQLKDIVRLNSTEIVGYDSNFENLCVTLYTDKKAEAAAEPERRSATNPFDYYSRHDNAGSSYLDKALGATPSNIYYVNNSGDRVALITNTDYTFNGSGLDSNICLIISTANVTITADFNGLVMCKGKVIVQGNAVLKPDTDSVDEALREGTKQGGGNISIVIKDSNNIDQTVIIENPRDYLYYTATEDSEEFQHKDAVKWDVGNLVHFDKWKKG
ncbi:MAG: hypothetical protein IJK60_10760 [Clostridia bacterium]|nr:hypothetical protein [Clostridia bacterium]